MIARARPSRVLPRLAAFVGLGLALACGSGGGGGHFFVAGWEEGPERWVPMLWSGSTPIPLDEVHTGVASSVAVDGDDVYVAGSVRYGASAPSTAVYWKNGRVVKLGDGTVDEYPQAIAVSGGSVYVAGYDEANALLWKDGVRIPLTSGLRQSSALAVAVADGHVYVAGAENAPVEVLPGTFEMGQVAQLWVDGVARPLTDPRELRSAVATGVAVSGGVVRVSGFTFATPDSKPVATVWVDGVATPLTDGTESTRADAVALAGDDVLLGGSAFDGTYDRALLWTNGVSRELPHTNPESRVVSLAAGKRHVYAAGSDGGAAVVWVNGVPQPLSSGPNPSVAWSVVVVGY